MVTRPSGSGHREWVLRPSQLPGKRSPEFGLDFRPTTDSFGASYKFQRSRSTTILVTRIVVASTSVTALATTIGQSPSETP